MAEVIRMNGNYNSSVCEKNICRAASPVMCYSLVICSPSPILGSQSHIYSEMHSLCYTVSTKGVYCHERWG